MSIAIKRNFTIPSTSAIGASELYITSSAGSTSTGTGALQVIGGAGISGVLSLGGDLKLFNGAFYTGFKSSATASTTYTLPATSPSTGSSVLSSDAAGNLSWILMSASSSGFTLNGLTSSTQYFATAISGLGFSSSSIGSTHTFYIGLAGNASTGLISSTSQTLFGLKTFASGVAITSGIASTNTTTGDLVVSGGVGVGDTIFVGNGIAINSGTSGLLLRKLVAGNYGAIYSTGVTPSSTNYSMITDGASVNFNGTNGVYFNISNSNKIQVTTNNINIVPTAGSSSTSTGALTIAGGVGIGGSLWTSSLYYSSISGVGFSNSSITSGVWSGTAISTVNGGTGIVSYAVGDLLYASSTTTLGKITAGTAGSVLTSAGAGATPYWAASTSSASGMTLNGLTTNTQYFATSISGSGFTIGSTGSTHTYYIALAGNASTGLISGAAQTIFGLKTFASGVAITVGTASTSTTTGALTVNGGVGITGQLSVNTIALGTTGVSVTPSMIFAGSAGTIITMSVLSDTTLTWEGSSGQLFSIDNNLSSGEIFSVSDISGLPLISASAGQTITLNEFGGYTQVGYGLASTSTTTGSLRVIGGIGITGNAYVGGVINANAGTNSTSNTSGAIVVNGGLGVTGSVNIGGIINSNSGTNSTSTTTGSIVVSGGIGVTGNIYVGGSINANTGTNSTSTTTGAVIVNGGLGVTGNANIGGTVRITNTTAATGGSTGALTIAGGVGIGQSLFVNGNTFLSGQINAGSNTFAKSLGSGDIALDNGSSDTPAILFYWGNNKNMGMDAFYSGAGTTKIRFVKELNESGGTELWSLDRNGIVTRTAWDVGETINTRMYNYSDLGMSATTTISSTSYTTFATVTYTPKSSSSYLWIEFSATYEVAGTAADDHWANIEVAGSEIVNAKQVWNNATGGGTRSGVLFPLAARYTNTGTAGIAISVRAKRGTSDDNNTIYGNSASGYMRIQEIGR